MIVKSFKVINSKGEEEPFSVQKVYKSARRVGASKELAEEIADIIAREGFSGIKTSEIFKKVKKILGQRNSQSALRFSLKQAMRKLGPTGFLFEKYIGEVLENNGFDVKLNQYLSGYCIPSFEIDFLAQKENLIYVGECKYRNFSGERIHSKTALANYARFLDILNGSHFRTKKYSGLEIKTMLVTNTKFTRRSRDYSECMGVELLGWRYPRDRGLEYFIESQKLYPITILPSLKSKLKEIFVSEKMMLAKDVLRIDSQKFAQKFKIPLENITRLIKESKILLKN